MLGEGVSAPPNGMPLNGATPFISCACPGNRTRKTKGCLNRKTALAAVFGPMMSAGKT